ncbi:MAG: hypothetical protein II194_03245, partial [Bacteroidales bacterium]|nr:hypothetical protein [Bacteroidales bacterium]
GHTNVSLNSSDVIARCRATGYKAIMSDIKAGRKPVTVTFDPSVMRYMEDDLFYVLASDLTEYTHLIYGDGVTLEYFVSDTIFFRFPEVDHKKVPVHPVYTVSYMPQHISKGNLEVIPDSVVLYGESRVLENIDRVFTEPIKYSSLSSDIQGLIRLEKIKNVRLSVSEVHYLLDVCRYVEVKVTLPVTTVNVPADKKLVPFPSSADVLLRFSFPLESDPEGLELKADYEDYIKSLSGMCTLTLDAEPKGLISYEVEPVAVNCVLEDR